MFIANRFNCNESCSNLIEKYIKPKTRKLFKLGKTKNQKLLKFQKSAKLKKKQWDSRNLSKLDATKIKLTFLSSKTSVFFNILGLTLTKVLISWYFGLKCYIWIKINALNYSINKLLN